MKKLLSWFAACLLAMGGLLAIGSPAQAALTYLYVVGAETKTMPGAAVLVTVAKPTVTAGDFHSLAEMAVFSADGQQAVEVGWSVDATTFGDNNPHFFATRWTNGVFGGYNDATWSDWAANMTVNRGTSLVGDVGQLKTFQISYGSGAWWVYYDNVAVGSFPASDWTSPTFTTGSVWKVWGEVAANVASPTTQMGNGLCAANTTAAKFSSMTYSDGSNANLVVAATNTAKYDYVQTTQRTFRYGGDGSCP